MRIANDKTRTFIRFSSVQMVDMKLVCWLLSWPQAEKNYELKSTWEMTSTGFEYELNSFGVEKEIENSFWLRKVTDWMFYSREWFNIKMSMNEFPRKQHRQKWWFQFNKTNQRYLCLLNLFNQQLDDSKLLNKEHFILLRSMKIALNLLLVLGSLIASFKFKCLNMILTNYQYSFHIITTHSFRIVKMKGYSSGLFIIVLNAVDVLNQNKDFIFSTEKKSWTVCVTATIEFWSHLPTMWAYPPFSACSIYQSRWNSLFSPFSTISHLQKFFSLHIIYRIPKWQLKPKRIMFSTNWTDAFRNDAINWTKRYWIISALHSLLNSWLSKILFWTVWKLLWILF